MAAAGGALYDAPSLASEGFIHCSTQSQVLPVARKFYAHQRGLVLLEIDPSRLTAALKWEAPSDSVSPAGVPQGESFPHVYGAINQDAVVKVWDFEPDENGEFRLPASMTPEESSKSG
jgi:uncharacterized protein (DUF952 family)